MDWETLDIASLLAQREAQHESTTSANVGAYAIPLGGMLRREVPSVSSCSGEGECTLDHEMWKALYGK